MEWFKKQKLWMKIILVLIPLIIIVNLGKKGEDSQDFEKKDFNLSYSSEEINFKGDFEEFIDKCNRNEINEGDIVQVTGHSRYGFTRFWNQDYKKAKEFANKDGYSDWIDLKAVRYPHYEYHGRFYLPFEMFDSLWNNKSKYIIPEGSNATLTGKLKSFKVDIKKKPTLFKAEIEDCIITK